MKKVLSLSALLLISTPIFADIPTPEWSEFAPYEYTDPVNMPQPLKEWSKKRKAAVISTGILSPVIPILVFVQHRSKISNQLETNNYWISRKNQFDKEIETCNSSEVKPECFMKIREMETSKNQSRTSNLLQVAQINAIRASAHRPTTATCSTYGNSTTCNSY